MEQTPTRFEALKAVLKAAGNQTAMAHGLGVTQATISNWINLSKQMPAEYVLLAEKTFGISRHHLRPDIYPVEIPTDRRTGFPDRRFHGVDSNVQRPDFATNLGEAA